MVSKSTRPPIDLVLYGPGLGEDKVLLTVELAGLGQFENPSMSQLCFFELRA